MLNHFPFQILQNASSGQTIALTGSVATIASDYTKKKNVFRLTLPNGAEYLLQADSVNEMTSWIQDIGSVKTENKDEAESAEEIQKRMTTIGSPTRPSSAAIELAEEGSKKEKKRKSLFGSKKGRKDKSSSELQQ